MRELELEKSKGFFKASGALWSHFRAYSNQLSNAIIRLLHLTADRYLVVFAILLGLCSGFGVLGYVWCILLLPFPIGRFAMMLGVITIFSTLVAYYNPQNIHLKKIQ